MAAPSARVRQLRGNKMAMIFQDPLSSLHPFYSVGDQIIEAYRIHNDVSKKAWTSRSRRRWSTCSRICRTSSA